MDRLRDERTRLRELAAGQRSVTAAIGFSYGQLIPAQRRLFRLLGLHPGTDIDRYAAAALAGAAVAETSQLLEDLVDVHLLQCSEPDRYRLHDLLRVYAAATGVRDEPEPARRAALTRLFDFYAGAALVATGACHQPTETLRNVPGPATTVPGIHQREDAAAWLEAERANLLAVAARAASDSPEHAVRLSSILFRYFDSQAHHAGAVRLHTHAYAAARRLGHAPGQADALRLLACVHTRRGEVEAARDLLQQALALYRTCDHRAGQAHVLYSLGLVSLEADRYLEALDYCRQASTRYQQIGDSVNLGRTQHALGGIRARLGQYDAALGHLRQAFALHRRAGNQDGHGRAVQRLGEVYLNRAGPERSSQGARLPASSR